MSHTKEERFDERSDKNMRYLALATDGDGTLLRGGQIGRNTLAALKRWRDDGRKLVLVTGQTSQQLRDFPHLELFDRIVAENGALLCGEDGKEKRLCSSPPQQLLHALKRAGIKPLKRGRLILQADFDQEQVIKTVLAELNTDWQIVRNRRDLMVLPSGISKATGLAAALADLDISPRQAVGIGDAENDRPLLECCALGVAVNNAVPKLKAAADYITRGAYGRGIAELIDGLLTDKLDLLRRLSA
jgi:hydroxymethylpyrimidine pyrophosphatase-like HAD family hydrolase